MSIVCSRGTLPSPRKTQIARARLPNKGKDRKKQTDIQIDRQTDTQTEAEKEIDRQRERESARERVREALRETSASKREKESSADEKGCERHTILDDSSFAIGKRRTVGRERD